MSAVSANQKMIVASDQHLGYDKSNVSDFSLFLDFVISRSDVSSLVILGDFIDMWRRDVSGLLLEHHSILEKILVFARTGRNLYVVAGNHDYHLLKLLEHQYPIKFLPNLTATGTSASYKLVHGWEFDLAQQPPVMEALCHNMSDDAGRFRSELYDVLKSLADKLKDLFHFHGGQDGYVQHLMAPPEVRLLPYIDDVQLVALNNKEDYDILVFGHTHRPFINVEGNVVNSGSWVSDAEITNTFVELDGTSAKLYIFNDANNIVEMTNRLEIQ